MLSVKQADPHQHQHRYTLQWEWPQKPWSWLHLDYAGPFLNRMFLVLVDTHSKWLEVVLVSAAMSMVTIVKLQTIFASSREISPDI